MILVTGASGFLGQNIVRILSAQGSRVRALYNSNEPSAALKALPGVSWEKYDLLDIYDVEEAMQDVTHLYHCAAIISFDRKRKEEMLHFNIESTANLVNRALEQGLEKMLHVSSVAALGRAMNGKKEVSEEEEWEENKYYSSYGQSKYLSEMEVWRGIGEGLKAAIINPSTILGAAEKWDDGSAHIMKIVYNQFPFYTHGINGWVDVEDVAGAAVLLMQSDVSDERFIISGGNYSFKDIFTMMAHALNRKPPRIAAGSFLTGITWRAVTLKSMLTGKPSMITKESSDTAQRRTYYDNEKFLKAFPTFAYRSVNDTINAMGKAFIQHMHKK